MNAQPHPPFVRDAVRWSEVDAAIVDLDGTLVDTLGDFSVALNRMLDELQLPRIAPSAVEGMVGKGTEHLLASVLAHVKNDRGHDAALFDAAHQSYLRHYAQVNGQHSRVFPGAAEGLQALRARGLRLACLTNKPGALAKPLLAAKGLDGFFDCVFGGDAFARKKPDPLPLVRTCEALGTQPARTLMIGDSSNDARAARAAHCPVVLVSYGYNHGEPVHAVDADGVVDSIQWLASQARRTAPAMLSPRCPAGLP